MRRPKMKLPFRNQKQRFRSCCRPDMGRALAKPHLSQQICVRDLPQCGDSSSFTPSSTLRTQGQRFTIRPSIDAPQAQPLVSFHRGAKAGCGSRFERPPNRHRCSRTQTIIPTISGTNRYPLNKPLWVKCHLIGYGFFSKPKLLRRVAAIRKTAQSFHCRRNRRNSAQAKWFGNRLSWATHQFIEGTLGPRE